MFEKNEATLVVGWEALFSLPGGKSLQARWWRSETYLTKACFLLHLVIDEQCCHQREL